MKISLIFAAWLMVAAWAPTAFAEEPAPLQIETLFGTESPSFWETPGDQLPMRFPPRAFRWTSETRETARAYKPSFQFFGKPIAEALLSFNNGKARSFSLVLYSRGDMGEMDFAQFKADVQKTIALLGEWANGSRPIEVPIEKLAREMRRSALLWVKEPHVVTLEWSYSEMKGRPNLAEYLKVRFAPYNASEDPRSLLVRARAQNKTEKPMTTGGLRANIAREPNGDVVIGNVPMVDQGPKGYCAVATTERVLKYYGQDVDQHVLAQIAQSSATGGTSSSALLDSIRKAGAKLDCHVREDFTLDYKALKDLAEDYDKLAKKHKKSRCAWMPPVIDIRLLFRSMDVELRKELAQKGSQLDRFEKNIATCIDSGMPMHWSVELGLVPENPELPQAEGGHIRLIIGYNAKTQEIIYTDSWGAGHELKHMLLADAYIITTGIFHLRPRRLLVGN